MSTLKEIGQRALRDREFFESLVKDPKSAVAKEGLSDQDYERLTTALQPTQAKFNLVEFIRKIHDQPGYNNVFGNWDTDWDLTWVPPFRPRTDGQKP